ncbi:unnamed protein product, partial [marine sediment metagenome]
DPATADRLVRNLTCDIIEYGVEMVMMSVLGSH